VYLTLCLNSGAIITWTPLRLGTTHSRTRSSAEYRAVAFHVYSGWNGSIPTRVFGAALSVRAVEDRLHSHTWPWSLHVFSLSYGCHGFCAAQHLSMTKEFSVDNGLQITRDRLRYNTRDSLTNACGKTEEASRSQQRSSARQADNRSFENESTWLRPLMIRATG
jgi:hypothetical protein